MGSKQPCGGTALAFARLPFRRRGRPKAALEVGPGCRGAARLCGHSRIVQHIVGLPDVLGPIADHKITRLDELMP